MTDPRIKTPTNILISGPTQSGKTVLTKRLLENRQDIFDQDINKIVYCYGAYQQGFAKFLDDIKDIEFVEGFPDDVLDTFRGEPGILVIDDLMDKCSNDQRMSELLTKHSHHKNITVIYIVQNLFPRGKFSRTISLNCHYIFAFKNCRDALGISTLVQQAFYGKNDRCYAMESFQDATNKTYGYLLFDMHPSTPTHLRLRSDIFPNERNIVYVKRT